MPILKSDSERIYFAHISGLPANELYYALLQRGYLISNLGPHKGDFFEEGGRFAKKVYKDFGIRGFQKEGNFKKVHVSLQHVRYDAWSEWGPFDYSFTLICDPMVRFSLSAWSSYKTEMKRLGQPLTEKGFEKFQPNLLDYLENRYPRKPSAFDNRYRSMTSFLLPQTKVYCFENGGVEQVSQKLGLGDVKCELPAVPAVSNKKLIEFVKGSYAADFTLYERSLG
jgi:hypothetical protein